MKEIRIKKKLLQDKVAERIGVEKSTLANYESGLRQPSYDVLIALANFYKVSTDYILGISNDPIVDLK